MDSIDISGRVSTTTRPVGNRDGAARDFVFDSGGVAWQRAERGRAPYHASNRTETIVAKQEWGTKRLCPNCGTRYYDMQHDPIVCPRCGAAFDPEALLKTRRTRTAAVAVVEPVAEEEIEPDLGAEEVAVPGDAEPVLPVEAVETEEEEAEGEEAEGDEEEEEEVIEDASELGEDEDDMAEVIENVDEEDE
jgi:uncharacterized protein (TIGR02300 family)